MPTILDNFRRIRRDGDNPTLKEQSSWGWPWSTKSATGTDVTDDKALSITAFFRGVQLIARTIAGLPVQVFQEDIDNSGNEGETRKLKSSDTAYLWRRPNPEMTRQAFWERVIADEVRGNAFIWVEKNDDDQPLALWWIDRRRVRVGRTKSGIKIYEIDGELPMIDYKAGGEIVHMPNWGDGLVGYDPVRVAAEAIALGLTAQEYVAKFVAQGSSPTGLITSDQVISEEDTERIAARWQRLWAGVRNAGKIPILGGGAKFQQMAVDLERIQMDSLRRYQLEEIERLLGLPPHLLADVTKSTSWGTGIEEQNRNLLQFNFQGHINVVEQSVSDDLLVRELTNRYMKMNLGGLLRGTTLQRYQALRLADFLTVNEKRAYEELPAVEGGDVVLAMTNQIPLDQLGEAAMAAESPFGA